jgi:hypothetical protein
MDNGLNIASPRIDIPSPIIIANLTGFDSSGSSSSGAVPQSLGKIEENSLGSDTAWQ